MMLAKFQENVFYKRNQTTNRTDFYHLGYSDNCLHIHCHIHDVSVDASFGLLLMYYIELRSPHRTTNWAFYLNHGRVDCFNSIKIYPRVQYEVLWGLPSSTWNNWRRPKDTSAETLCITLKIKTTVRIF